MLLGLESNGSHLGLREAQWNLRYKELRAYRAEHGHCNVPQKYRVSHTRCW
jgi:Helicase associated domain